MNMRLRHVGIVVKDLRYCERFWTDLMGFKVITRLEESGDYIEDIIDLKSVVLTTVKLKDDNDNIIELLKFHSHKNLHNPTVKPFSYGITHIALDVENLNLKLKEFNDFGLKAPMEGVNPPNSNVKVKYVRGPENILLELVETIKK